MIPIIYTYTLTYIFINLIAMSSVFHLECFNITKYNIIVYIHVDQRTIHIIISITCQKS